MSTIYYSESEKCLATLISKGSKMVMRDLPGDQFDQDRKAGQLREETRSNWVLEIAAKNFRYLKRGVKIHSSCRSIP